MKTINTKGLLCPKPLILTKKALKEAKVNEQFIVLIDNKTSRQNVERFLKDNNAKSECSQEGNVFKLIVTKLVEGFVSPDVEKCYEIPQEGKGLNGKHVYVFKNKVAEDDLGEMLTIGFIETLQEVEPLPDKIIFYHKGVFLALEDSTVLEELQQLEKKGIEILICGKCVDFYDVKDKVKVGIVTNAYDILKALTDASHLIYP